MCRELGDQVSWGNGCDTNAPPKALAKLKEHSEEDRECPACGSRFRYSISYEHAADHYMPDTTESLTRVRRPCELCRELADEVSWGNASSAKLYGPPRAVERLTKLESDMRECPGCGARFEYSRDTEHASDGVRPDQTLKRVR